MASTSPRKAPTIVPEFRFTLEGPARTGSPVHITLAGYTDTHDRLLAIVNVASAAFTMAGGTYPYDEPTKEPDPDDH